MLCRTLCKSVGTLTTRLLWLLENELKVGIGGKIWSRNSLMSCVFFASEQETSRARQGWISKVQFYRRCLWSQRLPSCLDKLLQGGWRGWWEGLRLRHTGTGWKNWVNRLQNASCLIIFEGRSGRRGTRLVLLSLRLKNRHIKWQSSVQHKEEFFISQRCPRVGRLNSGGQLTVVLRGTAIGGWRL